MDWFDKWFDLSMVVAREAVARCFADMKRCTICEGTEHFPVPEGDKPCECCLDCECFPCECCECLDYSWACSCKDD